MQSAFTDSSLDNILVGQKDRIIGLINQGDFEEVIGILNILRPLWEHCGYSYKRRELLERTILAIDQKLDFSHSANDAKARLHWTKKQSLEAIKGQCRQYLAY